MKKLFLFAATILLVNIVAAQAPIVITTPSTGFSRIAPTLDSDLLLAVKGDDIYLPGGFINYSGVGINKQVHIHVAGCNTDSSKATNITSMTGITLTTGADSGSIEGVNFIPNASGVNSYGANILFSLSVSNYRISYCAIPTINFSANPGTQTETNLVMNNNYLGVLGSSGFANFSVENSSFLNNIIISPIFAFGFEGYCYFYNNIFLCTTPLPDNSTFENNYFQNGITNNNSGSTFINNINAIPNGTNIGTGNVNETPITSTFVNPGGCCAYYFDFHNDYHLQISSLGKGAGSDG